MTLNDGSVSVIYTSLASVIADKSIKTREKVAKKRSKAPCVLLGSP